MKNIYLFIAFLLVGSGAVAQQRPQFTQYMMNNYLLNPALTGIEDYADVKLGNRQQWVGLEGAPVTYYISAHTPLNKEAKFVRGKGRTGTPRRVNQNRFTKAYPHHGLGIMALTDKTGPLRRTNINLSYAYHIPLSTRINLSTGAYGGLMRNSFNPAEATFVNGADPAISSDYVNHSYFDTGLGVWLYGEDFFAGVSASQILGSVRDIQEAEGNPRSRLQTHFFTTAGYKFRISPGISLIPSTLVKLAQPSPVSVDVNLKAVYADRLWVGASYRNMDALAAMVGVNVSHLLEVGYSYDANSSNLNISNTGTHEVVLGFKLFNRGKVICPHWLQ